MARRSHWLTLLPLTIPVCVTLGCATGNDQEEKAEQKPAPARRIADDRAGGYDVFFTLAAGQLSFYAFREQTEAMCDFQGSDFRLTRRVTKCVDARISLLADETETPLQPVEGV